MNKKRCFLIIVLLLFLILGIIIFFNKEKLEKQKFIEDAKTVANVASSYFNKTLDPKINGNANKSVYIKDLIKLNYLNKNVRLYGKITITMLNNDATYELDLKNDKYYFLGSFDNLKISNIKTIINK